MKRPWILVYDREWKEGSEPFYTSLKYAIGLYLTERLLSCELQFKNCQIILYKKKQCPI